MTAQGAPAHRRRQSFRPARSTGWIWPAAVAVFGAAMLAASRATTQGAATQAVIGVLFIVLGVWVVLAVPRMHYVIGPTSLILSALPVMRASIPLADIISVQEADLVPSIWASIRFPGLALRTVRYNDVGPVTMCATRAAKQILLIRTRDRCYGLTPQDRSRFVSLLADLTSLERPPGEAGNDSLSS